MTFVHRLRKLFDRIAGGGLSRREFCAVLVIDDAAEIVRVFDEERACGAVSLEGVPGLRSFEWTLFRSKEAARSEPRPTGTDRALLLSFVFDGDVENVLPDLVEQRVVLRLLGACRGFSATTDAGKYLSRHGVRSKEHFRAHPGERAASLRREFAEPSAAEAFPFPLTRFERALADEHKWVRLTSDLSRRMQADIARVSTSKAMRRGAHAKGHGFATGSLRIEAVADSRFRVGLFSEAGKSFLVKLRPSNGNSSVRNDKRRDLRGLALSVSIPLGNDQSPARSDFLLPAVNTQAVGRQDFLLASAPVFFATDILQFARLLSISTTKPLFRKVLRYLAFALSPGGFKQLWLATLIYWQKISHPLRPEYYSASPYLLGPNQVVKYSVRLANPADFADIKVNRGENFLSVVLTESLGKRPIELSFHMELLIRHDHDTPTVIEDATFDWKSLETVEAHVATLHLGTQDPTESDLMTQGEKFTFNPWHCLADHRPLGNVNRGRFSIYYDSANFRAEAGTSGALHAPDPDPEPPRGKSVYPLSHAAE